MTLSGPFRRHASLAQLRRAERRLTVTALGVALTAFCLGAAAQAAELLMFEQRACPFCEKFNAEIAPDYPMSAAGRAAPLRHVDIHESRTGGIAGLDPAVFTPTFVLVDAGHEIGRMLGYPGKRYFYSEIQEMFDRLTVPVAPTTLPPG